MHPEKYVDSLPHDAGMTLHKLDSEVQQALDEMGEGIEEIDSDLHKIENIEDELKRNSLS